MIALFGWAGNCLLCWSAWEIGNHRRFAHLLGVGGELCWIIKSLVFAQYDLAFVCIMFATLSARSWIKWGRT